MNKKVLFISMLLVLGVLLAACGSEPAAVEAPVVEEPVVEEVVEEPIVEEPEAPMWEAPEGALVSALVAEAPVLDGEVDALWADAEAITVKVASGANMGETEVTIKSVYSGDMVYFYMTYADPTQSFMRSPWVKQEDGTWALLKDPNDAGGDNNLYYEDKMSFIWNIDNSIPDFETLGCFTACHAGEDAEFKPYGNKYTAEEGQLGDMWHWKSVRNLNQIDDQYLDSTRYSAETAGAGRHGDPSDGGGYVSNNNEEKTAPAFMGPEGSATDGSPGWILESEAVEFDDSLFVAGDMVPGIVKSAFKGDRGNISAGWAYADGMWVIELGRALDTSSEFDVQYTDLTAEYHFGVAIFDNAQVRHAFQTGVNTFVFHP
ncbi:MAG: ethylbenzene dehydrogenase [Anaerolineae bacterium]|nr:ethylbenzene dehydrogenase [Anaerolineae bacterium]